MALRMLEAIYGAISFSRTVTTRSHTGPEASGHGAENTDGIASLDPGDRNKVQAGGPPGATDLYQYRYLAG